MNEVLLKYWVVCSFLLALKMWANSMIQAVGRFKNKVFVNPEDARVFGGLMKTDINPSTQEHPLVSRASLCWRNDLENIPLFLLLALGYVLIGGSTYWGILYFSVYTVARVLHTWFYMAMLQPWRTLVYEVGAAATFLMAVHSVYIALF